jgi:hypothetical protein
MHAELLLNEHRFDNVGDAGNEVKPQYNQGKK